MKIKRYEVNPKTGCWEWFGAITSRGYGSISIAKKIYSAHRVFYQQYVGKIPSGLWVLHKCDNTVCVNPEHLFLGTAGDNARDRAAKGRNANRVGENNFNVRLTEKKVLEIRKLYSTRRYTRKELSEKFKTCWQTIDNVIRKLTWAHI